MVFRPIGFPVLRTVDFVSDDSEKSKALRSEMDATGHEIAITAVLRDATRSRHFADMVLGKAGKVAQDQVEGLSRVWLDFDAGMKKGDSAATLYVLPRSRHRTLTSPTGPSSHSRKVSVISSRIKKLTHVRRDQFPP